MRRRGRHARVAPLGHGVTSDLLVGRSLWRPQCVSCATLLQQREPMPPLRTFWLFQVLAGLGVCHAEPRGPWLPWQGWKVQSPDTPGATLPALQLRGRTEAAPWGTGDRGGLTLRNPRPLHGLSSLGGTAF